MKIARIGAFATLVGVVVGGAGAVAQTKTFTARLSIVPITLAMQKTVTGKGQATAVVSGEKLTIEGSFEGLQSPATIAQLHVGVRGVRGPSVASLTVTNATSGSIKGNVEVTRELRQALERNSVYIQIHSQKAPDGNLWGWLTPQEGKP